MAGNGKRAVTRSLIFATLCLTAVLLPSLDTHASNPRHTTPLAPPEYLARANPIPYSEGALADARAIYERQCRKCHGPDGKGHGSATRGMAVKPPDFTDAAFMSTLPDGQLVWIILNGSDPDTTEMTGFKNKFSEEDAWKLVQFIRSFSRQTVVAGEPGN